MRIGFTGTQIGMTLLQQEEFVLFCQENNIIEFHHGDCIGADEQAHNIVREFFPLVRIIIHPPINSSKRAFCKGDVLWTPKEYLDRNKDIVNESDTVIAAPKENIEVLRSGTWSTIRYAKKANKLGKILKR
jgi:hypothetical protein